MIRFAEVDGLYCPVFICAQCGGSIQGSDWPTGLIQWDSYDEPTFTVLHKGECAHRWDAKHGKFSGEPVWVGWRDLNKFVAQLGYNTQHPFGVGSADT